MVKNLKEWNCKILTKYFFSAKKREQPKLIKDEIYKRIEDRKNQNNKGSILHADELMKFIDLK